MSGKKDGFVLEEDKDRFIMGRIWDEFMMMFQCDICHFRNIQKRDPQPESPDVLVLKFIRRAILDSFWSREPSTVTSNRSLVIKSMKMAEQLDLPCPLPDRGPFPLEDSVGMLQAII